MSKKAELIRKLRGLLLSAREIAERAKSERRDFTHAEREEVENYLAKAKILEEEIDAASSDDERKQKDQSAIDELERLNALFEGTNRSQPGAPGNKGDWAAAFEREIRRLPHGEKALITPSGAVSVPGVIDGLTPIGDKVETVLQLIPWKRVTGTDAISWLLETVRTHNAAPVAAGDRKPTSIYTVERQDDRVRTIAHLSEAIPKTYLADIALLRDYVRMVLREGYELELEYQILSGSGLLEEFTGILNTAGIQVIAWAGDVFITTRRAITALEVLSIEPGAYVFHPEDWETIELASTTTGEFMLKDGTRMPPVDRAARRLWGYPVALSLGIPEGTGLLVDWAGSSQGWEREAVRVDWSEAFHVAADAYDAEDSTGFERNLVKFRCEGRAYFALKRPHGAVVITLETGS